MKNKQLTKAFAILLALALALCMTACGESNTENESADAADVITSIEIGGDFGAFDLNKEAFGEYTQTDLPEEFTLEENETAVAYACEDSNTPLIIVKDVKNLDKTLEEYAAEESKKWGSGYYQIVNDGKVAYYTGSDTLDGEFYYWSDMAFYLGDSIRAFTLFKKTEEVQIGDSDLYFNIVSGYENRLSEASSEFGATVYAEYDESYKFPNIYACNDFFGYEMEKEYFGFLNEFNMTEEQYNKWNANWTDEATKEYLNALGYDISYQETVETDDFNVYVYCVTTDNYDPTIYDSDLYQVFYYIERNGEWYFIDAYTTLSEPTPAFMSSIVGSIHVKK